MDDVIDLDVLNPEPRYLKIADKNIELKQPSVIALLRMGTYSRALKDADSLSDAELEIALKRLTDQVIVCIPDLAGIDLNLKQLNQIVLILQDMAIPLDTKALAAAGITPKASSKKEQ